MPDADWQQWLGRTEQCEGQLGIDTVARIAAAFDQPALKAGEELPLLWHWCFFQNPPSTQMLADDGHPLPGNFLPPVHGRPRMWAGGRLEFLHGLRVGEPAVRHSRILRCDEKAGRSGALVFVTVAHEYHQGGQLCLREEQDIVYKAPAPFAHREGERPPGADWSATAHPTQALLFRYSAVTFNSHRIHYDFPYATQTEGYPGLVVHGPLIATLNAAVFVAANPLAVPRQFAFRNVLPLIAPERFQLAGRHDEPGKARLWAANAQGICQAAELYFD